MTRNADAPGLRILLIDDDEDDFVLLDALLRETALGVTDLVWARSSAEGLHRMQAADVDVCLLDYRLDARNGLELLAEARRLGVTTPVILLTAFGDPAVDQEALQRGAAAYMEKRRLTSDDLDRTIRLALTQEGLLSGIRERARRSLAPEEKLPGRGGATAEL